MLRDLTPLLSDDDYGYYGGWCGRGYGYYGYDYYCYRYGGYGYGCDYGEGLGESFDPNITVVGRQLVFNDQ